MGGVLFFRPNRILCLALLVLLAGVLPTSAQNRSKIEIIAQIPHTRQVTSMAFSPDGARLLSGSKDGRLKLWDAANGLLIRTFVGQIDEVVESVAFSADGTRVLSGSLEFKLWNAATGQLIRTFKEWSVVFSPNGKLLLSCDTKLLKLWDATNGQLVRSFEGEHCLSNSVAFSPDGARLLSFSKDNRVNVWDTAAGRLIRSFPWVAEAKFSPDSAHVLTDAKDNTVQLWDVATGRRIHTLKAGTNNLLMFSPDGTHLLSGTGLSLTMWDTATGQVSRTFDSSVDSPAAFSSKGTHLVSVGSGHTLELWDVVTGQLVRRFEGHSQEIKSVAFSPDGTRLVSGSWDNTLKLWDVATGQLVRTLEGYNPWEPWERSVAFSGDGRHMLSITESETVRYDVKDHSGGTLKQWDLTTGQLIRTFESRDEDVSSVAVSPDGTLLLLGSDDTLKLWDTATGKMIRTFEGHADKVHSVAYSPDGKRVLSGSDDHTLKLWDAATGQVIQTFEGHAHIVSSVAFSPDGTRLLSGSADRTLKLWDAATGRVIRTIGGGLGDLNFSVAFSPDGTRLASGNWGLANTPLRLWDAPSGQPIWTGKGQADVQSVAFSPDGTRLLSGSTDWDFTLKLWEAATGRVIRTFKGHTDRVTSVAFSPDGTRLVSGSSDNTVRLWDAATGKMISTFEGHDGSAHVVFSPDGRRIVTGGRDTITRIRQVSTGAQLAMLLGGRHGRWLTLTPDGFFGASRDVNRVLAIVRGLDVTSIDQVHQSLFNPDLVREALAGDLGGEVVEAAKVINLEKVLDSGPAPTVEITSLVGGSQTAIDLVTVAARITDKGRGIGRVEWRVNGVTAAVSGKPAGSGSEYPVTQELALDPGENEIEVVAYNGSNLLASLLARTTVSFTGPVDQTKPKLHVLVIGIDEYIDKGWIDRQANRIRKFLPLNLAVKDAQAFGAAMERAGDQIYQKVNVIPVLNKDATLQNLEDVIRKMAKDIHRRDTFVFFAAAHGISEDGRFYLIPQDYQGGPGALQQHAISQDRLQDWLANRIRAKKAIILLDTCESGALVAGYLRSRTEEAASEAGVGRLHEATGRPVLTAAAGGQFAHEGVVAASGERQGIFTRTVLDALKSGDTNNNGKIELSELVAYVQAEVPKLAAKVGGTARAETATTKRQGQSARFGSRGEDFVLVDRLQ